MQPHIPDTYKLYKMVLQMKCVREPYIQFILIAYIVYILIYITTQPHNMFVQICCTRSYNKSIV